MPSRGSDGDHRAHENIVHNIIQREPILLYNIYSVGRVTFDMYVYIWVRAVMQNYLMSFLMGVEYIYISCVSDDRIAKS